MANYTKKKKIVGTFSNLSDSFSFFIKKKKNWFKYINIYIYTYTCAYLCFWSTFECNRKKSNRLLQIRIALQPSYKCERAYRVSIQELSQISCKLMQLIVGNVTWRSCSATSRTSYRPLYNLFDIGRVWRHSSRIKTNYRIFDVFRCFNWSALVPSFNFKLKANFSIIEFRSGIS